MSTEWKRPRLGLAQIQYLLLLGGESAWISAWALTLGVWIGPKGGSALALPTVVAILAVALVGARLAATVGRQSRPARWSLALLGVGAIYLVASAELPALRELERWTEGVGELFGSDPGARALRASAIAALCWWRGLALGRSRPGETLVQESFVAGLTAMTTLLIMVALAGQAMPVPTGPLILSTLVLLSTGLIGGPMATIAEVMEQQRRRDPSELAPAGPWLGMVLAIVGCLLLAVLVFSQLLSFDRIIALYEAVRGSVGALLWAIVYLIALPIGLLVQGLVFLLSLLPRSNAQRQTPEVDPLQWLRDMEGQEPASLSPAVVLALQVALMVAVASLLLWLFLRALRRMRALWGQDGEGEIRDFVWTLPRLRDLWRALLGRLRPRRRFITSFLAGRHHGSAGYVDLRQVYRGFLRLGAALGRPRRSSETPLEYERRLEADCPPAGADDVRLITEGYLLVRYAPPSACPPDHGPFASALSRLRVLWQPDRKGRR